MRFARLAVLFFGCALVPMMPTFAATSCNPASPSECMTDSPACQAVAISCFQRNPQACTAFLQNCAPTGKLRSDAQAIAPAGPPTAALPKPVPTAPAAAAQGESCDELLAHNRSRKGTSYFSGREGMNRQGIVDQWDNLTFRDDPTKLTAADIRNGIEARKVVVISVGIEREYKNGVWSKWTNSRIRFACETERVNGATKVTLYTVTPVGTLVPNWRESSFVPDLATLPLD